jgi:hypothetical protein
VIEVMQDPRLKPVEIPPPARPICTLASLLVSPLACIAYALLCIWLAPMIVDSLAHEPHPGPGCRADPVQGAKLHMLAYLCYIIFFSCLSGLILIWLGMERNETRKSMRRRSFLLNATGMLTGIGLLFVFPQPLNALSHQKWFFPKLTKPHRP